MAQVTYVSVIGLAKIAASEYVTNSSYTTKQNDQLLNCKEDMKIYSILLVSTNIADVYIFALKRGPHSGWQLPDM